MASTGPVVWPNRTISSSRALRLRRDHPDWFADSYTPLAAEGPATATDLAGRLPITRQAIAKHLAVLAEVGLVTAEHGERRRVRYRLRPAPMQAAQQFLAALARDWDRSLEALTTHLDRAHPH